MQTATLIVFVVSGFSTAPAIQLLLPILPFYREVRSGHFLVDGSVTCVLCMRVAVHFRASPRLRLLLPLSRPVLARLFTNLALATIRLLQKSLVCRLHFLQPQACVTRKVNAQKEQAISCLAVQTREAPLIDENRSDPRKNSNNTMYICSTHLSLLRIVRARERNDLTYYRTGT
jgi:hypothetical protein